MGPSGVNRELQKHSLWCTSERGLGHHNSVFPPANHRHVPSSDFFIVQICCIFRDSNSAASLLPNAMSLSSFFIDTFLIFIDANHISWTFYFPYDFECLDSCLLSLLIMGLWHLLASHTNICLEGSRLGATLNLQTSLCWSPMLKLIISYSYCLLSTLFFFFK